jgi:hypothetical protein
MNKLNEMMQIADIHAKKIKESIDALKELFPLNQEKVLTLSSQEMLLIEMLISRFAKLQDYMGRVMIDTLLVLTKDYEDSLTMIDKLNKLERLGIIDSVQLWETMRNTRNHIAHEYPDQPALTAKYLNDVFMLAPRLLEILEKFRRYGS